MRVQISKLEANFTNLTHTNLILGFGQTMIRANSTWSDWLLKGLNVQVKGWNFFSVVGAKSAILY